MFNFLSSIFKPSTNQLASPGQPAQQPGLWDRYTGFVNSDRGQALNDIFTGWAMGSTPQESLGMGAKMTAMGRERRGEKAKLNQTVEYLKAQGLSPEEASLMASNGPALTEFLKQRLTPQDGLEQEYKRAQIDNMRSQIDERNNPSIRDQYGLNPIYGKDADGNLVVMQPSKAGGLVKANMPDGVTLQPGVEKVDLGSEWGIMDRSGQIIRVVPKDLAGAEAQKAIGGKQGDAAFDLPRVEQNAAQTLGVLERMKTHPGREGSTGFIQGILPSRNSDQVDFQSLVDQTQGQSFLQAFQMLKGAGQITEIEGTKATDAISRLRNQRLSDQDYLRAISDLEEVIRAGLARAKQQAGGAAPQAPANPQQADPLGLR
jgi:hypothetical protein